MTTKDIDGPPFHPPIAARAARGAATGTCTGTGTGAENSGSGPSQQKADSLMAEAPGRPPGPVLQEDRNCWRVGVSERASVLVDASNYFEVLEKTLRRAHKSILIAGWDFDDAIVLDRSGGNGAGPALGRLLRDLAEARPELHVRILIWSTAVLHSLRSFSALLIGRNWLDHPRITLKLDTQHAFYAALHQKIVTVDDRVAFVGGVDLTSGRWDTRSHLIKDYRRKITDGYDHGPVRDVQMIVGGQTAASLAELLRVRWELASGERLEPPAATADVWPGDLDPHFRNQHIGIARTLPRLGNRPPTREIRHLVEDMLNSARGLVYIEDQYFSNREVGDILEASLKRREGPEVIVISSKTLPGLVEQAIMGGNRKRLIRRLQNADIHDRFRIYFPLARTRRGTREAEIFVHSKLICVDNRILRIGSSNLNNRSLGVDTECDLVVEAGNAATQKMIASQCHGLMADLAGTTRSSFCRVLRHKGSYIPAMDYLAVRNGRLRSFQVDRDGPTQQLALTSLLDPGRRFRLPGIFRSGGNGE